MKLTADPKRIEQAHDLLQRLEDEVVGSMSITPETTLQHMKHRMNTIHNKIWDVIRCLNEAYDKHDHTH